MKTTFKLIFIIIFPLFSTFANSQNISEKEKVLSSLAKTAVLDSSTWIDINNVRMVTTNFGSIAWDLATGNPGLEYPRGTGKLAIFAAGIWMGGMVESEGRVALAEYGFEYYPGAILSAPGTTPVEWANGDNPKWKVLKLNKGDGPENPDYAGWKDMAQYDAPLDDTGNPLITGDQMLWTIFNDADPSKHTDGTGSTRPMNIEVQESIFAYDRDFLQDAVFFKFTLINKGPYTINDYFFSFWADPDLGSAYNDVTGCDTALGMGYFYNGDDNDQIYTEYEIAGGILLLKGLEDGQSKTLPLFSYNEYT